MADEHWQRLWELFHAALEIDPGERERFLREAEPDDTLRRNVEALLAAHDEAGGVLDRSPMLGVLADLDAGALVGEAIGPYRIHRVIGEGGMGVVYEAEQHEPVSRRVALKLIKLGMNTREVVARFDQERQALAMMNHPNIAQVYEAGATADGRPYFVMEYVEGLPITRYCDEHRLDTRQRLELFTSVLGGIQHAHQKGLIHRDIKPSNVLVTRDDEGNAQPKIIDFGIAKATDARATEQTLFTVAGRLIGTPAYMSPEQATLDGAGVDTRSDLYSLSVLLYELLTGALPFPSEFLLSAGYAEMQRIIREDEPPPPSRRLESLDAETLTGVAAARRRQGAVLTREVAGDLDWVVMKGLEKDAARRYESAAAFADDLRRFLYDLPVGARPPGVGYRLGKFVRRHTLGVAVAGLAALVLVVFTAATLWQARELAAALDVAQVEQRKAERVTAFLIDLLAESDPGNALGRDVTVREALDKGAERLGTELMDEPAIRAAVLIQMAEIYRELGGYENAARLLALADESLAVLPEPDAASRVELLQVRANLLHDRGELQAAAAGYRDTLAAQRAIEPLHANVVRVLEDLGVLHIDNGNYEAAIAILGDAVATGRRLWPGGHELLATAIGSLAYANYQAGRNTDAAPLFEEAVTMHRRLTGDNSLELAYVLSLYGNFLRAAGRQEEAVSTLEQVTSIYRDVLDETHPYYATSLINLGSAYSAAGRLADAERTARDSVRLLEQRFEGPHPNKVSAYYQLGAVQIELGRYAEAEANFRRVLELDRATLGEDHPYVFSDLEQLAVALKRQGRLDEAETLQREALTGRVAVLGADHPDVAGAELNLSGILGLKGDDAGSVAAAERAVELLAEEADTNRQRVAAQQALASAYHRSGRYAEAAAIYRRLVRIHRQSLPADHPDLADALHGLGIAHLAMDEPAVAGLAEALAIRESVQGPDHPETVQTRQALAEARRMETGEE